MSNRELIRRIAARYLIARDFFEIGDPILFGKYKNKKGVIVGWGKDHKGNPTVFIDPIPKGRKKTKEMGLFKFWHNPPPLIKQQQEAEEAALSLKVGCIIAGRKFDEDVCLFKNRDRAYDSEVEIVHLENEGTEMAVILDPKTGFIEGVNEHGIGVVNTALMVARDEAEGKKAGKSKGPMKSKDGPKIYKALAAKNLKDAVHTLITEDGGIKGHTFVSDGKELICIECSRTHPARVTKLDMDRVNTRTNHGISYPDAGYTKGDDYVSSIVRRWEAQKRIQDVKHPEDIGPALLEPIHKKDSPFNPIRDTDKMRTTSQLLINTTRPRMVLYLIPGHGALKQVRNMLPGKRDPKIPVRVIQYEGEKDTVSEKDAALIKRVAARYKSKKKVKKQDGGDMTVYEYSDRQIADRNRGKAKRIEGLRKSVDKLRTQVKKDLKSSDEKTSAVALAVALMDHTFERVGNEGSAKEGHFGVTTWNVSHVKFSGGKATVSYVGKSGVDQKKTVTDGAIVKALKSACKDKGKKSCVVDASASDVNSYLKPFDISAKDIRGFHANTEMKAQLKKVRSGKIPSDKKEKAAKLKEEFTAALEATAEAVGHEPSTLKSQYLVPGLEDDYMKDGTINESHTKKGGRDRKEESQREDEQAQKMLRKEPKKKPPRYDLRNNRTLKERDEDMEGLDKQDGGDEDLQKDVRRQARRIAFKWLALPHEVSATRVAMRHTAAPDTQAKPKKGTVERSEENQGWIGFNLKGNPQFFPDSGGSAEDKAKAYSKGEKFKESPKEKKKKKKKEEPEGETKPDEESETSDEPTDEEVAQGEAEDADGEDPAEGDGEKAPEDETPEKKIKRLEPVIKEKEKALVEAQNKILGDSTGADPMKRLRDKAYFDRPLPYGNAWEDMDGLDRSEIRKAREEYNQNLAKLGEDKEWEAANAELEALQTEMREAKGEPEPAPWEDKLISREIMSEKLKKQLEEGKDEEGNQLLDDERAKIEARMGELDDGIKEQKKKQKTEKSKAKKEKKDKAKAERQKGVDEATKITTELIGPGSTLPKDVKKALTKALGGMSDLEAAIFAEEFKKSLGDIVEKPGDTPEAATLANEAIQKSVGDIKDPKELAKAAAEIAYARNVVANPKILGGTPVSDTAKTPEQMAARINEAAEHYLELDHSLRLGAAETLEKEIKDLDPKSNLAKELNGILTGIATAAVIDVKLSADGKKLMSDPTVPGRPQPSVKAAKLLQAMYKQDQLEQMFMPMQEGLTSPAGREALKQGMLAMENEDLIDQITDGDSDHPLNPLTELLKDEDLNEEIKQVIREALIGMSIDSMTWGDAAIREVTNEDDPNKRLSMIDQDSKEKREFILEVERAAKAGETGKFVSTNSEDDGSGVSNDEGVGLMDVMRAQQVSNLLDEQSEGADATPSAPSAAVLREYADSKDPSVLETEVSPTPEEFRSDSKGKKSGSKSHLSVYRSALISEGLSYLVQSPAPTNRRQTSMPKITETGAREVTVLMDRLATLFQSDYGTLGVPQDVADDMALRCDMLSDRIETHAGLRPRQAQMDPPSNYTEEKVPPGDFNPAEIGEESSQAFLRNEDEPYMDAFTQDENDQLRQVQQDGMFSNAKAAAELIQKLQARLAATEANDSAQKKTELNDELAHLAASLEDFAALDDKVAEFREAAGLGKWNDLQAEAAVKQLTDLEKDLADAEAEIEALAGEVLKRKAGLEKDYKAKLVKLKKELPETLKGQGKEIIAIRQALIKYTKVAEQKRPGAMQMIKELNADPDAEIKDRGGDLIGRVEDKLGAIVAKEVGEIYDTVMEELTALRPVVRGLKLELKQKNATTEKEAAEKEAGIMTLLVKFRDWTIKQADKLKRLFGMGTKRIDNAGKRIDSAIKDADKGWDMAMKNASDESDKTAGEIPEAFKKNIEKMKAKGKDGDKKDDDKDDKKDDEKSDDKKDDKDSGKPWEKDKKAAEHGFDLTA